MPVPPLHMPPIATHWLVLLSQQPPPVHELPGQHGWPGPPHGEQLSFAPQARPEAVQKLAWFPPPLQHCWPAPPQLEHAPPVHWPSCGPHVIAEATHVVPAQQPPPVHVEFAQHGCPGPPQATKEPPTQSWPFAPTAPAGTQLPASRQAPPRHMVPPHAGWSGPPHGAHWPMLQESVVRLQVLPAQHAWPAPPQPAH